MCRRWKNICCELFNGTKTRLNGEGDWFKCGERKCY